MARLVIQPDHLGIKQLWRITETPNGVTTGARQITWSQHDVLSFRRIRPVVGTTPGLVSFSTADPAPEKARHGPGHAVVHLRAPASLPTKVVMVLVLGQSNAVGAGATDGPTVGPITVCSPPRSSGRGLALAAADLDPRRHSAAPGRRRQSAQ